MITLIQQLTRKNFDYIIKLGVYGDGLSCVKSFIKEMSLLIHDS